MGITEETQIRNTILEWLNYQPGILAFIVKNTGTFDPSIGRFRSPGKHFRPGVADIIFCYRGKFGAIEVKRQVELARIVRMPGKFRSKTERDQMTFHRDVEKAGGFYIIVCSLDQVIRALKEWWDPPN